MAPKTIVLFCWLGLLGYWLIAAFSVKTARKKQSPSAIFWFRVFQVVTFILLAGIIPFPPFNFVLWHPSSATNVSGIILCIAGFAVAVWARRTLASNWSASVTYKEKHELITNGPYRFVRHPIYSGLLLMMVGTVLVIGRLDTMFAILLRLASYYFKIRSEEAILTEHFSDEYHRYMANVSALVPFPKRGKAN